MQSLGTLGPVGTYSIAYSVNALDQVVGVGSTGYSQLHAFLCEDGTLTDLGTLPGGSYSIARGISPSGEIVADSYRSDNLDPHAIRWVNGRLEELGDLGGGYSSAKAINAYGEIVGVSSRTTDANDYDAFVWQNGVMTALARLGGSNSQAFAINAAGQIAGEAATTNGRQHAALWSVLPRQGAP